ncbi:type II secretion system protein GspI [Synechococcus moorigangaii CMS01]|nr:type II secretion system protein GspI [Synechococcus moorigangaii CMS01]
MRADAGFSLVEMLVALVVLAVAGLAMVQALTQSARAATLAEDRALAALAAENVLADWRLERTGPPRTASGQYAFAGRAYEWRIELAQTPEAGLVAVSLEISPAGSFNRRPGFTLTQFERAEP